MQQLHPPSAWDNDLLSLYSLEFHQERAASFSSQQQFAGTLSTFMIIEMEKARKKNILFRSRILIFPKSFVFEQMDSKFVIWRWRFECQHCHGSWNLGLDWWWLYYSYIDIYMYISFNYENCRTIMNRSGCSWYMTPLSSYVYFAKGCYRDVLVSRDIINLRIVGSKMDWDARIGKKLKLMAAERGTKEARKMPPAIQGTIFVGLHMVWMQQHL